MMVDILLSSLPANIVVEYHRFTSYGTSFGAPHPAEEGAAPTDDGARSDTLSAISTDAGEELARLLRFLRVEIESRERTSPASRPALSPTPLTSRPRKAVSPPSALVLQSSGSVEAACFFCDGEDHRTGLCSSGISLEERKRRLVQDNRCFRCTKRGHRSKDCRSKSRCITCGGRHAVSMCNPAWQTHTPPRGVPTESGETANVLAAGSVGQPGQDGILLQTFRGWAVADGKCAYIRGIIDGGSQKTFVREDLATKLQLDVIGYLDMRLNTFANTGTNIPNRKLKVVRLRLRGQYTAVDHVLEAIVVPFICTDLLETPVEHSFVRTIPGELADEVMFPSVQSEAGIGLLLGADQMWRLMTGETRRSEDASGLVAIATLLGWTFQGPTSASGVNAASSTTNTVVSVLRVGISHGGDSSDLRSFWELESLGIVDEPATDKQEQDNVIQHFKENITMREGRYEVALPWKNTTPVLKDNYGVATTRLHSLVRRLERDGTLAEYDQAIRRYLEDGHAERVREDTLKDRPIYYMPHRAVLRQDSVSTKLRVVFDASAHAPDTGSLNDHLEKGPKTNTELLPVLLRFRLHPVAVTADIEKAFLQIAITDSDRDALRFLWFSAAPRPNGPLPAIEEWRMTRVPFGSKASPFLLGATLRHHLTSLKYKNEVIADILLRSFYVDDLLTGAASVDEAEQFAGQAQELLRGAGMELRKWSTNSLVLQRVFDERERNDGKTSVTTPIRSHEVTKVLGLVWDKTADSFTFSSEHLLDIICSNRNTKRSVLQASARIFDPLGFLAPYVIRVKMMFQRMWQRGLRWDDELPGELREEWTAWCAELSDLHRVTVPRCLLRVDGDTTELQLHVFTDASPHAYGACAYLRAMSSTGEVSVTLIIAKARVSPLRTLSLPRLELMGALLGVRLAAHLRANVFDGDIDVCYWTDSMVTLGWIRGSATKWKPFVCNRVTEIQTSSDPSGWRHCPGTMNPADLMTRGKTVRQLSAHEEWWFGPDWLKRDRREWPPVAFPDNGLPSDIEAERRQVSVLLNTEGVQTQLMTLESFGTYRRMLRVTAWVLRFVQNCRRPSRSAERSLTTAEIRDAESFWIRQAQQECFTPEIQALSRGEDLPAGSRLKNLQPFLDGAGLLRIRGRLQQASVPEDARHPILLPKEHHLSKLVAASAHQRTLHGGVQATMTELRERFWLLSARRTVKAVIGQCRVCRRFSARPANAPVAPLPRDRVHEGHPFQVVGIDFAGPLFVKTAGDDAKAYIALFTCATTRAVHLELVSSVATTPFLLALRRFVARRGIPSTIYSDNALTFKRAARDLRALWETMRSNETQDYCSAQRISWKFIVERAPWWGGWWERLVRSVKVCLRKILGRQSLSFEELTTILVDVEATINSRPLTYLHADAGEPAALTPAHLLIGRRLTTLPEVEPPQASSRETLSRRWKYRQRLMDQFWRRWKQEYLLELRSAHLARPTDSCPPKVGDVVLLHDDNTPRQLWRTVRVTEVFHGRDGHVRACTIRLPSGASTRRPVQLLYPLETM